MIDLVKANPDIETLKLTLWLAGAVISALFGVIIYFIKSQDAVRKNEMVKLNSIVETLVETVNSLRTIVEVVKSRQLGDGEFCHMKHDVIDRRLNEHSKRLDVVDNKVTRLETKLEK
jgi:hypothetical protein